MVEPMYVPNQSYPEGAQYLFAYHVIIRNESRYPVQLLSREWSIINAHGKAELIEGPGVVGETPLILPKKQYQYTSYCPLDTHWGTMEGAFLMKDHRNQLFKASIGRFYLATPHEYVPNFAQSV